MRTNSIELHAASSETLIRAYGEFWSRDAAGWKGSSMPGHRGHYRKTNKNLSRKEKVVEAWEQRGIYAIYNDFKLVYVGEANSVEGIGSRLYSHHSKPRLHRRWDSFSWFGIDGYDVNGNRIPYEDVKVAGSTIARTLELVAILIADPPLNRATGKFKGSEKISQVRASKAEPSISETLKKIEEQLRKLNSSGVVSQSG